MGGVAFLVGLQGLVVLLRGTAAAVVSPDPPTKIVPSKICRPKLSGKFPMDMRIPLLEIKILLEPNPLKSIILVRRLAVGAWQQTQNQQKLPPAFRHLYRSEQYSASDTSQIRSARVRRKGIAKSLAPL